MYRRLLELVLVCISLAQWGWAQEVRIWNRTVQAHGFVSQGFVYTNQNNWLTMNTTEGSGAMTEMGLNVSSQITDKFRVGAQVYDRNLGELGQWHPSLDWAVADYRFKNWLGIRAGKVKTTLGLYNDSQDLDFLHVFALLPQSIYPTDLRDTSIAHAGGDRRYFNRVPYAPGAGSAETDVRGWYVSGAYRLGKHVEIGSYYSYYSVLSSATGVVALILTPQTDTRLPQNHVYDKVLAARVDLNRFVYVKVEGHFIDGYGIGPYPDGFYPQQNPTGFKPTTNALVAKTGFHF